MFPKKRSASFCLTVLAATLSILATGCGSSNNGMSNNSMSQAQAQAVTNQVGQALTEALTITFPSDPFAAKDARPSLAGAVGNIAETSTGCTSTSGGGESCNFPISLMNYPCGPQQQGGTYGTISVTGDVDGTVSGSGAGSLNAQITITPTDCLVSNLTINGAPSIQVTGQINFTAGETPVFPVTFTETGGISYGPNPSGSCQVNATYTISSSLACTVSGTVCGQPVSGSC
jgi:hypothetical protein